MPDPVTSSTETSQYVSMPLCLPGTSGESLKQGKIADYLPRSITGPAEWVKTSPINPACFKDYQQYRINVDLKTETNIGVYFE